MVRFLIVLSLVWWIGVVSGMPARADEVTVKGDVLKGKVVGVTKDAILFETTYGKGTITIPFKDIESLTTDERYLVLFGDEGEASGKLLGVEEGALIVGDDAGEETVRVVLEEIVRGGPDDGEGNAYDRFHNKFRYWTAEFDFGFAYKSSTTDETDVTVGFLTERIKDPTRFFLEVNWLFETEKNQGEDRRTADNEIRGVAKGEYRFNDRWFGYTSHDGEYDELDNLSLRYVGKVGPGYYLIRDDVVTWQVESGLGYAFDRFFGGDREEFGAIPLGTEVTANLPGGIIIRARADYLASLQDWSDDYLVRGTASVSIPLYESLSLKFSVLDTYDNTPDAGSEKNEFKAITALSFRF